MGPSFKCLATPEESRGPAWRLVLLGPPGVGKGTQAELISACLGTCHLSTGDVFRAACRRCGGKETPAMAAALEFMRRGDLVPDDIVWEAVRERVGCLHCHGGFILDGFPRTLSQAESLQHLLEEERLPLHAVIRYSLPLEEIVARLSGRRTCEACKAIFHISTHPPQKENKCDHCGGKLCQREDDRPESIAVRMEAYKNSTAPLIQFYQNLGLLTVVQATGSPEQILERTLAALKIETPLITE